MSDEVIAHETRREMVKVSKCVNIHLFASLNDETFLSHLHAQVVFSLKTLAIITYLEIISACGSLAE